MRCFLIFCCLLHILSGYLSAEDINPPPVQLEELEFAVEPVPGKSNAPKTEEEKFLNSLERRFDIDTENIETILLEGESELRFKGELSDIWDEKHIVTVWDGSYTDEQGKKVNKTNIGLWELESGKLLHTITSDRSLFDSEPSFFERKVFCWNETGYCTELWNIETGKLEHSFPGSVRQTLYKGIIVTGRPKHNASNAIQIWDIKGGERLFHATGTSEYELLIQDEQKIIAYEISGRTVVHDLIANKEIASVPGSNGRLSSDGKKIFTHEEGSDKVIVRNIDETGEPVSLQFISGHSFYARFFDGGNIVQLCRHFNHHDRDWDKPHVFMHNLKTGHALGEHKYSPRVLELANRYIDHDTQNLHDLDNGKIVAELPGSESAVSKDEKTIICTDQEKYHFFLVDSETGKTLKKIQIPLSLRKNYISVSLDEDNGKIRAHYNEKSMKTFVNAHVYTWDIESGEMEKLEREAFGYDNEKGRYFTKFNDDENLAVIWDMETYEPYMAIFKHETGWEQWKIGPVRFIRDEKAILISPKLRPWMQRVIF